MVVRRVAFVTSNAEKLREVREVLAPFGLSVEWERRRLPEPQSSSLEEVVRAKLAAVTDRGGPDRAVLVEDSGIFLRGLNGFPGVYSSYVYDTIGLAGVLRLLGGKDRRATFRTVAGVRRGRSQWTVEGRVEGTIALSPRGANGFGYDPIFRPVGERRTFAELAPSQKNLYSHRGRAIRSVARALLNPGRRGRSAR